eukprot:TRINITY_DN3430_c0_g2_i2.p1 TRINITY_DN3430_c0_g2~~TRINITY_DN3430_c0_g2_i2.p1  ORF type:complete len:969 (-),score=213.28 TRINITY_DN3430_c0_g2_i2:121-2955(-)
MAIVVAADGAANDVLAAQNLVKLIHDKGTDTWVLHHRLTEETTHIMSPPHGEEWELDYQDETMFAYFASESETHWASDFFHKNVYRGPDGLLYVKGANGTRQLLDQLETKCVETVVKVSLSGRDVSLLVGVFDTTRGGARAWWKAIDLFAQGMFTSIKRTPPMWVQDHLTSWGKAAARLDLHKASVSKSHADSCSEATAPLDDDGIPSQRLLPFRGLSSHMLILVLVRLTQDKRIGGFKDLGDRQKAFAMLAEIIGIIPKDKPRKFDFRMDSRATVVPGYGVAGSEKLTIDVINGNVSLAGLVQYTLDQKPQYTAGRDVAEKLHAVVIGAAPMALVDFLIASSQAPTWFYKQVIYFIGLWLDRSVSKVNDRKLGRVASRGDTPERAGVVNLRDCLSVDSGARSRMLCRYLQAGREHAMAYEEKFAEFGSPVSIATDASRYGKKGCNLHNLVTPDNISTWCVPQVDHFSVKVMKYSRIPDSLYHFNLKEAQKRIDIGQITGFGTAPWYSPGPPMEAANVIDLEALHYMSKTATWDAGKMFWRSTLLRGEQRLMIRCTSLATAEVKKQFSSWHFVLGDICAEAVLTWPTVEKPLSTMATKQYYVPDLKQYEEVGLKYAFLSSWDAWEVVDVNFWSPLRQYAELGGKCKELKLGSEQLLCVINGPARPFLEVAARNCFWKFGLTVLHRVASDLGLGADAKGRTLYQLLRTLIMHILKVDDEDVLPILQLRVVRAMAADLLDDMLSTDEGLSILETDEQDEIGRYLESAAKERETMKAYKREFKEARAKVQGKVERNPAKKASPLYKVKTPAAAPAEGAPQSEWKSAQPPGGHIWLDATGRWHCKQPPYQRTSITWAKAGGYRNAALWCTRLNWKCWLEEVGLDVSCCPIKDLFADKGDGDDGESDDEKFDGEPTPAAAPAAKGPSTSAAAASSSASSSKGPVVVKKK